jgi:uncharacterized protein (DUF58 family)
MEGFCAGLHRSPHQGHSVEFREHRSYVRGDEIRSIDWKLFGKTDRLYIRQYEEETNLRAMLLLDQSGSMRYQGTRAVGSKHYYAVRIAACLAYLMVQHQDGIGLMTFDEKIRSYLPPHSRKTHLHAMLQTLEESSPGAETEIAMVLRDLAPKLHRRGLLVLISDCFTEVDSLLSALAYYKHGHYDVLVIQIWDPDELDFPFQQRTEFRSLEVADRRQLVEPHAVRKNYLTNLKRFRDALREGFHRHRIEYLELTTDRPYADALAGYISIRSGVGGR